MLARGTEQKVLINNATSKVEDGYRMDMGLWTIPLGKDNG
jgi:hypothetical protein